MPLVLCTSSASIVDFEKNHGIITYNADGPVTTEFLSIAQLLVNSCNAPIIELSNNDKRKIANHINAQESDCIYLVKTEVFAEKN